jgi:hypothetical protein
MSKVDLPPMLTSWLVYPTEDITSVPFDGAEIENWPVVLVEVPLEVPFTVTLTPFKGAPASPVTVPDTVISCAETCKETSRKKMVKSLIKGRNPESLFLAVIKRLFIFIELVVKVAQVSE